ncbi:hypothetical protein LSTR_LSTR014454 [Laodelphax striatellus]|uniref:Uncharacterized protein n=1 Tax=Laodelphax striatellus TaxID=195883 RepID=A0A482XDJ2_LAOST|nr:hypothetical protein LSTR_LSTR014454 [Laodelphax striatellus]
MYKVIVIHFFVINSKYLRAAAAARALRFKRRKNARRRWAVRGAAVARLSSGGCWKRGLSALATTAQCASDGHASTLRFCRRSRYRRRRISPQQTVAAVSQLKSTVVVGRRRRRPTASSNADKVVGGRWGNFEATLPRTSVKVGGRGGRRRRPVEDFVALADSLDNYFCEFYFENGGRLEDRYASTMQKLRDAWVECHSGGSAVVGEEEEAEAKKEESLSPSTSKRLAKPKHSASTSSSDSEPHCCVYPRCGSFDIRRLQLAVG